MKKQNEPILETDIGTWWGRTCTGQSIYLDYNIQELAYEYSHDERLYKKEGVYDLILVLNYNMNPIRKNLGSAIFIHVTKKGFQPTQGCIALDKSELIKLVKSIKKNTVVNII